MKKKYIKGLNVLSSFLLSGVLAVSLSTCSKDGIVEIETPSIERVFSDSNDTLIDDLFLKQVSNSESRIDSLKDIERMINLLSRIEDLDRDIVFDFENEDLNRFELLRTENMISGKTQLESIEELLSYYESSNVLLSANKRESAHITLISAYHQIAGYLLNRAPIDMECSLLDLAKVIGVDTANLHSIDNMKVYVDEHHKNLAGNGQGWFEYKDDNVEQVIRFEEDSSKIYELVSDYIFYKNFQDTFHNTTITDDIFKDIVNNYKKTLYSIVDATESEYEMTGEMFKETPIIKVKK